MQHTKIEWIFNPDGSRPGWSWSPITGCLNNCPYCYARRLANGRLKQRYLANRNVVKYVHFELMKGVSGEPIPYEDPFYPRFWEERVREKFGSYTGGAEPKGIFVCDMGDLFGQGIPETWTRRVLSHISMPWYKEHRFYLLTKQPQNLIKFSPFPDNCWVGVTATNREQYLTATGDMGLDGIKARIKYISFEPLLEQIGASIYRLQALNWVIIGAQTKPYKPPKIEWVEEIVKVADKAGMPVFLKNNLLELVNYQSPKTEFAFNKEGYYRQEIPKEE